MTSPKTTYWPNGKIRAISYLGKDKRPHRENAPALVCHSKDGLVRAEIWMVNGEMHRVDGPAMSEFENDELRLEKWYAHDKLHRLDGPSIIMRKNGAVILEKWFMDGAMHCASGPAVRFYDKTPDIWALKGRILPPFDSLLSGNSEDERRSACLELLEALKQKDGFRSRNDWKLIKEFLVGDLDFIKALDHLIDF